MGYENSGRRPQPTALKVLRGNPGKRKPSENEPQPPAGDVVKPSGLTTGAAAVWDEVAPICLAMRTLTPADVKVFATLCELQATFAIVVSRKGTDLFDARQERDTANVLRPFYALFGLEPVSRARISVLKAPKEEPAAKWAGVVM
jgi:phage terminase small subunit